MMRAMETVVRTQSHFLFIRSVINPPKGRQSKALMEKIPAMTPAAEIWAPKETA